MFKVNPFALVKKYSFELSIVIALSSSFSVLHYMIMDNHTFVCNLKKNDYENRINQLIREKNDLEFENLILSSEINKIKNQPELR